jgi:hypothetical protein
MPCPKILFYLFLAAAAALGPGLYGQSAGSPQSAAAGSSPSPQHAPAAEGEDIRDIRGPIPFPNPWFWAIVAAGGLAGAVVAYAIYRAWSKRVPVRPKTPYEIALERIENAQKFIAENKSEDFSVEVSTAVRAYIEEMFHVHAPRKTTEEFLHDLIADSSSVLARHAHLLEDFLNHCDLAKFAQWSLSADEMQAMSGSAKRFVMETRPDIQPQQQPAAKVAEVVS